MQLQREQISPTTVKLSITADQAFLTATKQTVLNKLSQNLKVPGFRPGKAPANLVEKRLDQTALQSEFIDQAINRLYVDAVGQAKLRPVASPQVTISKFVPFNTLEFAAEVETVGDIKLANYKTIKLTPEAVTVTAKDVTEVLDNLRQRVLDAEETAKPKNGPAKPPAKPKLDDAFAATIGPFKTLAELKADIKKQLKVEKQQAANRAFENDLLKKIADKTTVAIPASLIEEEIDRLEEEEKRNVVYRGQTWQEHLDAEDLTAEAHREQQRQVAELRVKTGLILGEIAEKENVTVTPQELEIRIQLLKGQYPDPAMQAELDKPENRRDIHSRLIIEKTLDALRASAAKPAA